TPVKLDLTLFIQEACPIPSSGIYMLRWMVLLLTGESRSDSTEMFFDRMQTLLILDRPLTYLKFVMSPMWKNEPWQNWSTFPVPCAAQLNYGRVLVKEV